MKRAFTLIEILVVVGIIAILAAILTPMIAKSRRAAEVARDRADLVSLQAALDAYKADASSYPPTFGHVQDFEGTGFASLGRYLFGPNTYRGGFRNPKPPFKPGDMYDQDDDADSNQKDNEWVCLKETSSPPSAGWARFDIYDGKEGPGIKRPPSGRTFGPYIDAGKFNIRGLAINDRRGNPILYMPVRKDGNIHAPGGYSTRFELKDIAPFFDSHETIWRMLGDTNLNGMIDPGEKGTRDAYILWGAGADGKYGTEDDITSFQ